MTSVPIALMSGMRNEGIHLLEWPAYHRVIGFGPIVVCTNDCEDGSDRRLGLLARHGAVDHLPAPVPPGASPRHRGVARARLADDPAEWLAHLDSDEFRNFAPMRGLIARAAAAHTTALPGRGFGDSGHADWPEEALPTFTRGAATLDPDRATFKPLCRFRVFASASDHRPTAPRVPAPFAVNGAREPRSDMPRHGPPRSRDRPMPVAMRGGAAVIHCASRFRDVFRLKTPRGNGTGQPSRKDHRGSAWRLRAHRNEAEDRSILRRWPEVQAKLARLRALPVLAEATCHACFFEARDRLIAARTTA